MSRILVIEDEPNIQKLLKINLSYSGYEVVLADNGKQGLEVMERTLPDMVILDIKMPVMSGWDFLKSIRLNTKWANIPVLLIIGYPNDQKTAEQKNLPYLVKPFTIKEVFDWVESVLNKHTEIIPACPK